MCGKSKSIFLHSNKEDKLRPGAANETKVWTSQQVHPKVRLWTGQELQTLQASVSMLNVKVHDSKIRKRLNTYSLF